jgi:hypothetical protein
MNEEQFAATVAQWLAPFVAECEIATKKSVLYDLSFDEQGQLHLGVDEQGEPKRGRGTGFEQDILVFERVSAGQTSIVPRVIAEVKLGRVTTHGALTYSEKARRIRTIYPFVRYGLLLGQMTAIPGRVLRLGQEFDFIAVVSHPTPPAEVGAIGQLFHDELQTSKKLGAILAGRTRVKILHRSLETTLEG